MSRGGEEVSVSQEEVRYLVKEIEKDIDEAFIKDNVSEIRSILERIRLVLQNFGKNKNESGRDKNILEINNLRESKKQVEEEIKGLESKEKEFSIKIEEIKKLINKEMEALRDLEREKFSLKVKHQELSSSLELILLKENSLKNREQAFQNEIKEGVALLGSEILAYRNFTLSSGLENKSLESREGYQFELKKKIERIKIKLEDSGLGSGEDILREFKDVSARDEFLAKEMEDLAKSIESLKNLIIDLKAKIDSEFKEGVKKINREFQEFFSILFGGGTAGLSIVVENKKRRNIPEELEDEIDGEKDEEIIFEQGIEISVSLPHKKVRELQALSGGERSLTSIALLFAMSQVNPPPFLVLDETDAALDEANSRKYGDMLEKLSHHSQLIVVTHNRETMSRAGMLYGVTIGSNGASKLLSIKFEEAAAIAK
jgi:chromosome segregation protein